MQVESCPDPLISANIYCAGQIDSLIGGAIAPFWRDLSSHSDAASFYLWLLRYDKGGEHLKIRLHGRGEIQAHVAELLQDSVASFFADQPPTEQAGHTGSAKESPLTSRLPPIDVEDEAGASVPNRTLVFTQYRRSPISLGPKRSILRPSPAAWPAAAKRFCLPPRMTAAEASQANDRASC